MNDRRPDLIRGQGWGPYASSIAAHALMFGAVGPAIGAVASPGVIIYPVAVVAAYYVSFTSAVVAGLLVGLLAPFARKTAALYAAGAAAGAICAMVFPFAFMPYDAPVGLLIMYAISGGFAGLVCTRLTRAVRRRWLAR